MDENVHSFNLNIPKPRVFAKKSGELIKTKDGNQNLRRLSERKVRKPSDVSLTKYYLSGKQPLQVNVLKRDELLLPYRQYILKQKIDCHKQRLSINISNKYKITSTELRQRLHVEDPPDDVYAVTDIDKWFFKHVNYQPLSYRIPLYKSLQCYFHKQLIIRQEIGYRKDCLLNIDVNFKNEQNTYDLAVQRFMDQAKCFDNFISDDYKKSMEFLNKSNYMLKKVDIKNSELQNAAADIFTITSRLIGLDYRYGVLQKYGRFLYYLSPPLWRMQNREFARSVEIEAKGFGFGASSEDDNFIAIFEKMQKECSEAIKPVLYFSHPNDLMEVFDTMEQQQLHYFAHVTHMTPYSKTLKDAIQCLTDLVAQDTASVANLIGDFESLIEFYKIRSDQLVASFFKILNGPFYESVGTPEVFKFHMHLEFCYEKMFYEKPINTMDIFSVAKAIENFYMSYTKRLDALHSGTVQFALQQCLEQGKRKNKTITEAVRELRYYKRLKHELTKAYAPLASKSQRMYLPPQVKIRSTVKDVLVRMSKTVRLENKEPLLTEAEKEYLALFTDWTEHEDPALYLQSLSRDENE